MYVVFLICYCFCPFFFIILLIGSLLGPLRLEVLDDEAPKRSLQGVLESRFGLVGASALADYDFTRRVGSLLGSTMTLLRDPFRLSLNRLLGWPVPRGLALSKLTTEETSW